MRGCLGVFTKESLTKIERRVRDERQAKQLHDADPTAAPAPRDDLQPNPQLEAGRTLPARLGDFPPELYGKPIEELDEFYFNKYVSAVPTVSLRHCTTTSPRCRVL